MDSQSTKKLSMLVIVPPKYREKDTMFSIDALLLSIQPSLDKYV